MSERIIDKIARLVNQGGLSLAEALEIEAPDADIAYWRRQLNRHDPNAPAKPKRKRARRASGGNKRKRSSAHALTVKSYLAVAELVRRVNKGGDSGE